jgi:quercetin dioxygenase-like cupin family protein
LVTSSFRHPSLPKARARKRRRVPRSTFTDDVRGQFRIRLEGHGTNVVNMRDPSRTLVARITVQPGARFPWPPHSGPVIVTIAQGELGYATFFEVPARVP